MEKRIDKFERVKLSDLVPYARNARTHSSEQIKQIQASIREFGFVNPVLIDGDKNIIAGHGRVLAAKAEGLIDVPCVFVEHLTDAQKKAYILADNRLALDAGWDMDVLKVELEELKEINFDIDLTGFNSDELSDIFGEEEPEIAEDDYEVDLPEEPKTKLGDIYQLGRHRLLCGDSTDRETVEKLMNGAELEIVYTDPPYSSGGYQESGKTSGSIGARGGKKIETDNLSTRGYISLMDRVLALSRKAHTIFIFCDWKMWATNQDIAEAKGYRVRNMIVWDKCHMGMGMPFRNQHELCLFGSKLAGKIGDGKTPNVISVPRDRESKHATPKPVELIKPMLNQIEGDTVYDPFGGSGSTLIACEQLNRTCYMMELDPKYCDVIIDRWEQFTGQKAVLL